MPVAGPCWGMSLSTTPSDAWVYVALGDSICIDDYASGPDGAPPACCRTTGTRTSRTGLAATSPPVAGYPAAAARHRGRDLGHRRPPAVARPVRLGIVPMLAT